MLWVALGCRQLLGGQWTVLGASVTSPVLGWLEWVCHGQCCCGGHSHGEDKVHEQGGEGSGSPGGRESGGSTEEGGRRGRENWGEGIREARGKGRLPGGRDARAGLRRMDFATRIWRERYQAERRA